MPAATDALAITGATATGKSELALHVAGRLDAEIISMDSRQVYIGMDIGTAKVPAEARAAVPHHGLDLVRPDERYSAGRFARDARRWVDAVLGRGRVPVLVGGTGFFLRALTNPLFDEPPMDRDRRRRLEAFLRGQPEDRRAAWLRALDPGNAARLAGGGGAQRVLRALEVALLTGRPLGWWQRRGAADARPMDILVFVLELPRDLLDERINRRVDAMIEGGLVQEVRGLLGQGFRPGHPGMNATGYPEIAAHLRGELTLDDAADAIRRATRRYARRQLTWFRNQLPAARTLDGTRSMDELADTIAARWAGRESP